MVEANIIKAVEDMLVSIKEDPDNVKSAPLFKKVIANSAPIWTSVEVTPSACFYLSDTSYSEYDKLRYNGNATVMIYVYNKHKTRGLSLKDILSPLIDSIRAEVQGLSDSDPAILNAFISRISRDGGTVLPYTVAELTVDIEFTELRTC